MEVRDAIIGNLPPGFKVERVDMVGGRFISWRLLLNGRQVSTHATAEQARQAAFQIDEGD